jgi:outer membrane protein assembly factor BamB
LDTSQAEGGVIVQTAEGRWIGDWIAGGLFRNEIGEAKFFTGRSRYYGAGATIPATATIDGNPAAVWTLPLNASDTKSSVVLVQIKQEKVRVYNPDLQGFGDEVSSIGATEVWGRRLNCGYSTPTIDGDRVFVTTMEGDIHCLSLKDGRTLWQGKLGGVTAANQVTVTGELCAALTLRGQLTIFRKDTGEKAAQFELPGGYCFGKPLLSGGFVYLANTEGIVARFQLPRK